MSTIAEIKNNEAQNGIEVYFNVYPLEGTKETLKKYGFRWSRNGGFWYAKQSADTENIAGIIADTSRAEYEEIAEQTGETVTPITRKKTTPKKSKSAQPETINLDNLGENAPHLYGAELAKAIRNDLKKRGVTGVTVRKRDITYDTGITVTVKATSEDFASLEEAENRYSFGQFCCDASRRNGIGFTRRWISPADFENMTDTEKEQIYREFITEKIKSFDSVRFGWSWNDNRDEYWEITTAFYNKLRAVYLIANQWNYNNNDSMTDYYDVGYYLDIDIKQPEEIDIREKMTDADREAYAEEVRQEEEKKAAELARFQEEEEKRKAEYEAYEAKRKNDREVIENDVEVVDLAEPDYIYVTDLKGGSGKECTLDELRESEEGNSRREDALITRKVIFHDLESFNTFGKYLLDDFDFLQGKGGTASEDIRLENVKHVYDLNTDQRESVKWYFCDCVGIYLNDVLLLVSDPEGYSYSRYTFELSNTSEIKSAATELEKQRAESENKPEFYFPDKIEEQVKKLNIGDAITIYKCDGWMLNNVYGGQGVIKDIQPGNYAQYTGIFITLNHAGKDTKVFLHNENECLIYKGIKPRLPEELTQRKINDNMHMMLNYTDLFPAILNHYEEKPIVDTIQR